MKALYEAYDMRPTRMALFDDVEGLELEEGSGRSPFPSSLTCLLFAKDEEESEDVVSVIDGNAALSESIQCLWTHPQAESEDEHYNQLLMEDNMEPIESFAWSRGTLLYPLPPGLLPHGLRHLQLTPWLRANSPLQVGSIPSTVEVLQLDYRPTHPLSVGMLPSSLVHLVLWGYDFPLSPHVLPPSLQRLHLSGWSHPLTVNLLPASLRALDLSSFDHPLPPHILPAGLTHLCFRLFNHPLSVGSLPPSLVSLDLGEEFQHPLLPHALPSSLRVFFHSRASRHPLVQGVLPEGLVVLHWCWNRSYPDEVAMDVMRFLPPTALPSSLRVLDLAECGAHNVRGLPVTVRWLKLSQWDYARLWADLQGLSANTRVVWG